MKDPADGPPRAALLGTGAGALDEDWTGVEDWVGVELGTGAEVEVGVTAPELKADSIKPGGIPPSEKQSLSQY